MALSDCSMLLVMKLIRTRIAKSLYVKRPFEYLTSRSISCAIVSASRSVLDMRRNDTGIPSTLSVKRDLGILSGSLNDTSVS